MPKALITSRDPKGLQFMSVVEAVYNKAGLDEARAQRLNENGGELKAAIKKLIEDLSVPNRYADEEVSSNYGYPNSYAPRPISEQIDMLAGIFSLSLGATSEYVEKVLPTLELPDGAEGWFAIPSIDALAARFFPEIKDPKEKYCRAIQLVVEKIASSRKFYNYRAGCLGTQYLRQSDRMVEFCERIAEQQKGDIWVIPAQFGKRHAGRSVRRAREVFGADEFGLDAYAIGCMLLANPDRLTSYNDLWIDCPSSEYSPGADGRFDRALCFGFRDGRLEFGSDWAGNASAGFGSASAFLRE